MRSVCFELILIFSIFFLRSDIVRWIEWNSFELNSSNSPSATSHSLTLLLLHVVEVVGVVCPLLGWVPLLQTLHDLLIALFDYLLRSLLLILWVGVVNQCLDRSVMHQLDLVELLRLPTLASRILLHFSQLLDLIRRYVPVVWVSVLLRQLPVDRSRLQVNPSASLCLSEFLEFHIKRFFIQKLQQTPTMRYRQRRQLHLPFLL